MMSMRIPLIPDEIVGVFKEKGTDRIKVKYDKDWILHPDDEHPVYPVPYSIKYEEKGLKLTG